MDEIKQSLDELHQKIDKLLENQTKINNHVNFVEDVYSTVRQPLNFICNKINRTLRLPQLTDNSE